MHTQTSDTPIEQQFLAGGGMMGALMRKTDWSLTPLGDPVTWPQSLKTCVRIVLTSRQPMFVWWGDDLINLYNDAYLSILGGKHPQALGQPASVVWSEIWNEVGPRAATAMRDNVGTYDEALLLIMERNGYPEETYYTFSYSPVPGDDGKVSGIICANTDDTERIVGERQMRTLKDLGSKLASAGSDEDIYERTIAVLQTNQRDFPFAALYEIGASGDTARLTGTTAHLPELMMSEAISLADGHSIMAKLLMSAIASGGTYVCHDTQMLGILPSGEWKQAPERALVIPVSRSGQKIPFAILVVGLNPYRQPNEKYLGFFSLVADQVAAAIANVRAYEEERKRAEALVEIDRAKTTFFSNISHEFRTPLTLMLGPLESLLEDKAIDERQRTEVDATHRNAMRLLRLVNTLLDFSRIEAGRMQGQYAQVDIAAFTTDLASGFRSLIETAGLEFDVQCDNVSHPAYVDVQMWEKIVLNLLSNAFKYTFRGKISVSLKEEQGMAVLRVADTGIGIPAAELPRMFDRFHRVQEARGRTHEGTGIGLSLVKELVKMHGGTISVDSEEGHGSVFTVTIPLGKEHLDSGHISETATGGNTLADIYIAEAISLTGNNNADDGQPENFIQHNGNSHNGTPGKKANLLVVDDNADMRNYVSGLLSKDYNVTTVAHGKEALEHIAAHPPQLVVSDIMMPVMDGIELLHAIKSNPATAAIPVILLSARAGEEARIEGYDTGADDYLVKPFAAKELQARVRAQLRLAQKQRLAETHIYNLFVQAPVAIGIFLGPEFIIDMANDKILEYWGRTFEEVIHRPVFDVLPELQEQGFRMLLQQVYETGVRYVSEGTLLTINRHNRADKLFITFVYEPLREEDGTISGVMVVANDITTLYSTSEKLKDAEERMRLAADGTGLATWDLDLHTRKIIYTPRLSEIFGYSRKDEMTHEAMRAHILAEDRDTVVEKAFREAMRSGIYEYEARIVRKDGMIRWIRTQGRVMRDSEGLPTRMLGTMIDITDAKTASRKLEDSELRYRQLIQNLPVALYTCTADGRIEMFNDAAVKLWGRVPDTGKELWDGAWKIYKTDGTIMNVDEYPMAITLRTGKSFGSSEVILERPDGSRTHVLLYLEILKDAAGKLTGAVNMIFDLTERRIAAENIERLATIVQSSDDAIISKTLEGIVTTWNDSAERILGYTEAEMIGQSVTKLMPPERHYEEAQILEQLKNGRRVSHFETQRLTKNGRLIDVAITVSPMRDEKGNLIGASKILRDITDRKLAEKALRESEERFRTMADTAPVMIWIADSDKRYSFFNKGWLDFTGMSIERALEAGWSSVVHPDDLPRCMELYGQQLETRQGFEMEYRMLRYDGMYRWVVDHGVPRYSPEGALIGYIGSCVDIHERKEASKELEIRVLERTSELSTKNEELMRQKDFVENILDASVDVICVLDRDLKYIAVNRRAAEMYGENLLGKNLLEKFPHVRETGMYDDLLNALSGEIIHRPEYRSSIVHRSFENFYIPLKDMNGTVREIMLIGHDITDYMNASQELKKMNEALVKSNAELEQFAYVSSHDLQEPLRKIQTFSDLLSRGLGNDGFDARKYIEKINASAERMSVLIKDLLSYSRLSKTNDQFVDTDLQQILDNIKNDFEVVIRQKQAQVRSVPLPVIKAIPIQINQLFYNLIGNALKFSENAPVIDITCSRVTKEQMKNLPRLNPQHTYVTLGFKDNGIGFEQVYAEKIFTIFQRLNDRQQYSGTGIGLAICKKIAENHGGYIEAHSRAGEGATFTVYLAII
jgi:PAS domain S-box-containing protein